MPESFRWGYRCIPEPFPLYTLPPPGLRGAELGEQGFEHEVVRDRAAGEHPLMRIDRQPFAGGEASHGVWRGLAGKLSGAEPVHFARIVGQLSKIVVEFRIIAPLNTVAVQAIPPGI